MSCVINIPVYKIRRLLFYLYGISIYIVYMLFVLLKYTDKVFCVDGKSLRKLKYATGISTKDIYIYEN